MTLPATKVITTAAIQSGSAASIGFGAITFKTAGDYSFTITETNDGQSGMTYAGAQTIYVQAIFIRTFEWRKDRL